MKSLWIFLICALIITIPVKADTIVAHLHLNILNDPPQIENITFSPETAFSDSVLECKADIIDEFPEAVILHHEWYINGELKSKEETFNNFKAGDNIECRLIPNDTAQNGTSLSVSIEIKPAGVSTRFLKNTLNMLGSETTLEEINSYQDNGLMAITGFAVAEAGQSKGTVSLLGILIILVMVNINLIIRRRASKKAKHPKQDYLSS